MSSKDQLDQIGERRREIGEQIANAPDRFKICNGCQSLNCATNTFCPFCNSYGFESNCEEVVAMARLLGRRPLAIGCAVLPRATTIKALTYV
jgi:hypothetical protein